MWNIAYDKAYKDCHKTNYFVVDTSMLQILLVWQYMKRKSASILEYIPLDDGIYMSVLELLKNARSIYWKMPKAYIRNLDKIFYHLENIWFCILLDI